MGLLAEGAEAIKIVLWSTGAADACAHVASYGVGIVGGLFVVANTIWRRVRATVKARHGGG